jgi:succinate dehydrogenase / fumarate reductase, iron-sulfur subunit
MDMATCIGCGACVVACPNGSASLFTGAKIGHFGLLPQGQPERDRRVVRMVERASAEGFGVAAHGTANVGRHVRRRSASTRSC